MLVGHQEEHLACKNWVMRCWLSIWSEVQMICMWSSWRHCHPIISCFISIQIDLTFLALAYPGCPRKQAIKQVLFLSHFTTVHLEVNKIQYFQASFGFQLAYPEFHGKLFFMVVLCNRADQYIFALWFISSFFIPRLMSAAADWMSTILLHMVWP